MTRDRTILRTAADCVAARRGRGVTAAHDRAAHYRQWYSADMSKHIASNKARDDARRAGRLAENQARAATWEAQRELHCGH
jgi:hypothetical protein